MSPPPTTADDLRAMRHALSRIAEAMGCEPEDDDDLVEAVRLLVAERDQAKEQARLGKLVASRMQAERDEARMMIRGLESKIADYERRSEANAEIANQARAERDEARAELQRMRAKLADRDA